MVSNPRDPGAAKIMLAKDAGAKFMHVCMDEPEDERQRRFAAVSRGAGVRNHASRGR